MDGGQGLPDFGAQGLQPFPLFREGGGPFLKGFLLAGPPPAGLGAVRLRRNFKGDALFSADFGGKNGKGSGHAKPHFPASLFHAFLHVFVHAKVYHNLCHESHSLQHISIIAFVKQNAIFFFTMAGKFLGTRRFRRAASLAFRPAPGAAGEKGERTFSGILQSHGAAYIMERSSSRYEGGCTE